MPSLQKKGNGWYCQFLYHGKRYTVSIGSVPEKEAVAKSDQIKYLLSRLSPNREFLDVLRLPH